MPSPAPPADPILDSLNPAQRSAASADDRPLLIIAGAGTGKKQTLAHRVAALIHRGSDSRRILLLTFSRRASQEMTRRAVRLLARRPGQDVGDRHVFTPRTRFIPDSILDRCERARPTDASGPDPRGGTPAGPRVDIAARLRATWSTPPR